ncbi:MAG: DUF4124 domain-containing protein [Moraxellaceae bacterium]
MNRRMAWGRGLVLALLWLAPAASGGQIYSWKDKDGRVHFSDKPVQTAERVNLPGRPGGLAYQPEAMYGNWVLQEDRGGTLTHNRLLLEEGGRFSGRVEANGRLLMSYQGRWTLKRDLLEWQYEQMADKPVSRKEADRIVSLDNGRLVLQPEMGGRQRVFWRP